MATKSTQLHLTDEQRKKLAADLALDTKMDRIPKVIYVVKVSSKLLPSGPIPQVIITP